MTDRISVTGMEFFGRHGVLPKERRDGQTFVVDVVVEADVAEAGRTDDLTKTVDYRALWDIAESVLTGEPVDLIEALAERIATRVLAADSRVEAVEVTVHKPHVPLPGPLKETAVRILRIR